MLAWIILAGGAMAATPAPAPARGDRVILRVAAGADASAVGALHRQLGGHVLRTLDTPMRTQIVTLPAGRSVAEALAHYRGQRGIASAEPDFLLQALTTPNDFHFGDQWNLRNLGMYGGTPGADIDAEAAWDVQREAASIIVAIVDSGVRSTHEDLAANMWVNPGESGVDSTGQDRRTNGRDDDGNGYIDDVHGINVLTGSGNPNDDWGHGTHVAGIVGAVGNNSVGVSGVAWRVKLMACKFIDAAANYSVSDAITALDYARRHGARIVTASWGGYAFDSPALRDAIAQLRASGIIVAAAVGNDNNNNDLHPLYPASYSFDNIIAVAATNRTDGRAGYSNYGATTVDLGAPGSPVFSAWAGSDRDYRYNEGTSMAAPHLAGACALLWSRFPTETHQQIIQRLLSAVDLLPSLAGVTKSGGRLNLAAALGGGASPPPPAAVPAPTNLSATAVSATEVRLTWSDNAPSESGYEVERSTDNTVFTGSGTTPANATTTNVPGLSPSTTYYFRVRAVQGTTTSAYSNTASATTPAAPPPPPPPPAGSWTGADVGAVAAAGHGSGSGASFSVTGSGADIWDRSDEFHFHHVSWTGDGTFVAQVSGMTNTDGWAKAGLMLRDGLGNSARHIFVALNPGGLPAIFWRNTMGGTTDFRSLNYNVPRAWLKLARTGSSFQASQSADGVNWTAIGAPIVLDLPATVLAGLAVTSHRDGILCTATFEQVSFPGGSSPPPPPTSVNSPSALAATTVSTSQINLSWTDNATNETGFQVERSANSTTFTAVATLGANVTSYADTGLAAGTTYYHRVRAVAGSTSSGYSNTASATTAAPPPPPPTVNSPSGLSASAASTSQINLSWTDNANNETGFQVERSTNNATFALVGSPDANASSYTDTGLASGTTYYYRVRAVAGSSASSYSNTTSATTAAPPPPPAGTWSHADVGAVGIAGSDDAGGITYTVRGSGSDIWDRADGFHFLYQTLTGDCVVEARVTSMTNTNGWAKAGVMIRESLSAGARNAFAFMTPNNGAHSQLRAATDGTTSNAAGPWGLTIPRWVRLTRTGNVIVATQSADGQTWQTLATYNVAFNSQVLVGFAVTSHDNAKLNTATFEDPFVQ